LGKVLGNPWNTLLWQSCQVRLGAICCGFCCCHFATFRLPLATCHFSHFAAALKFKACHVMLLIFRPIKSCGFGSQKLHCWEPLPCAPPHPAVPSVLALSSLRCSNEFLQHLLQGYCPLIKSAGKRSAEGNPSLMIYKFLGKFSEILKPKLLVRSKIADNTVHSLQTSFDYGPINKLFE